MLAYHLFYVYAHVIRGLQKSGYLFYTHPKEHMKGWVHLRNSIVKKRFHPCVGWGRSCGNRNCLKSNRDSCGVKNDAHAYKYLVYYAS